MVTRTIKYRDIFKIMDEDNLTTYYGCNQEWYMTEWQRRSGCGPTVVTNIVYYLKCMRSGSSQKLHMITKSEALLMMEGVWHHVTPTMHGIPTTKLLYDSVVNYSKSRALNIKLGFINIQGDRLLRPDFSHLLLFLDKALCNDTPIAFLNLDNGGEKQLDSWHWVTIISLEYAEDESTAHIDILDNGIIKKIDLVKWFDTTLLGGGFVSLDLLT
ncbi:hypothetical protein K9O30_14735 [Clostridium bowmanii]|uniref:hypothetical protein n=1 Tax=Clostridium bowmanii TaxID=132925 RepID=UPI001C0C68BD|nr:hypothetical protein [Clostridium bowmanii]MBU3190442.1 hypothetical protein [Clostridium bowmanii]MCA1074956.1 hypothetical protein [Clostridium bowmanii]